MKTSVCFSREKRERSVTDHSRRVGLPLPLSADLALDAFSNSQFTCPLADLCKIGSRKAIGHLCQEVQVHILLKKMYIKLLRNSFRKQIFRAITCQH